MCFHIFEAARWFLNLTRSGLNTDIPGTPSSRIWLIFSSEMQLGMAVKQRSFRVDEWGKGFVGELDYRQEARASAGTFEKFLWLGGEPTIQQQP